MPYGVTTSVRGPANARRVLWVLLALLLLTSCGGYAHTTRRVDGRLVTGRPVSPRAYALYFEAAVAEARGDLRRARDAYLAAEEDDAKSPELWTRIGALSCRLGLAMADAEMAAALELDPWYAPAWRERARCELSRGHLERAMRFAQRSQVADPKDIETTILLKDIHVKRRALKAAEAQLVGYTLSYPNKARGWIELERFARGHELPYWAAYAAKRLRTQAAAPKNVHEWDVPCRGSQACDVDEKGDRLWQVRGAILAGDLAGAQQAATKIGLPQLDIVVLALRLGKPALSVAQSRLLIGAAPHDTAARLWGLLAAHRAGDDAAFGAWLALPALMTSLDDEAVQVLDTLLRERAAVSGASLGITPEPATPVPANLTPATPTPATPAPATPAP